MTKKNEPTPSKNEDVGETDPIIRGIKLVESMPDEAKVSIKGKLYATVARRNEYFWKAVGIDGRIENEIIEMTDTKVVVGTKIFICDKLVGNDFAEEYRNQGPVNKTSALENCVTSSIGRALSCVGLSGGEYASSFEVDNAINNKPKAPVENELATKIFKTFSLSCETKEQLKDWWKENAESIAKQKAENKPTYDAIVQIFKDRALELETKEKEMENNDA